MTRALFEGPNPGESRSLREAIHGFYHEMDPTLRQQRAHQALGLGYSEAVRIAAGMFIETAYDPELPLQEREELFEQGNTIYERLSRKGFKGGIMTGDAATASTRLALRPAYEALVLRDSLPTPAEEEQSYTRLLHASADIAANLAMTPEEGSSIRNDLIGCTSEISVQLLLMRFGIREVPGEYGPFFTFVSEDYGDGRRATIRNRWDVSVYTEGEEAKPPKVAHKVQVKTTHNEYAACKGDYAEDIAVVYTLEDLKVGKHALRFATIIQECFYEAEHGVERVTPYLNRRTNQLLDIMG